MILLVFLPAIQIRNSPSGWLLFSFFKKICLFERQRDAVKLIHSSNAQNSWVWARRKLGAWNFIQVSHLIEGIQVLEPSSATSLDAISRQGGSRTRTHALRCLMRTSSLLGQISASQDVSIAKGTQELTLALKIVWLRTSKAFPLSQDLHSTPVVPGWQRNTKY